MNTSWPAAPPRALIAIPHYAGASTDPIRRHAAQRPERRAARLNSLRECLIGLHSLFGDNRYGCRHHRVDLERVPPAQALDLDIRLVVKPGYHLLDELDLPETWYKVEERDTEPLALGFEARDLLARCGFGYDWYGYMEDDLVIEDPLFFLKLDAFNARFRQYGGQGPLLQPVRYERPSGHDPAPARLCARIYPDLTMKDRSPWADDYAPVDIDLLGRPWRMSPTTSPHSGCFFLTRRQLKHLIGQPTFHDRETIWLTPLDTAATLAIALTFPVFKPDTGSESFLEIRHNDTQILGDLRPAGPGMPPHWDHPAHRRPPLPDVPS